MKDLKFKLAKKEDLMEIMNLYHNLIGTPGCTWDLDYPNEEIAQYDIDYHGLYVLRKKRKIVAVGSLCPFDELSDLLWKPQNPCELARLGVDPVFQEQGLGSYMLKNLMRIAKEKGYDGIILLVSKTHLVAQHLYEKNGFEKCGEVFRYDNEYYYYQIVF